MDWELFAILFLIWIVLLVIIMMFFQGATMKGDEYEELFLKEKNKVPLENEPFEYRKHLNNYILKVYDKNKIEDLYSLGNVKYTSAILNIVGFECTSLVAKFLEKHPNVISIHEANDDDFCLDDVASEEYKKLHEIEV